MRPEPEGGRARRSVDRVVAAFRYRPVLLKVNSEIRPPWPRSPLRSLSQRNPGDSQPIVIDPDNPLRLQRRPAPKRFFPGVPWHPDRERLHPALRREDCRFGAGVRCGRRRLGFALTAASGDSSSEHDHSPGSRPRRLGTRHRRPCRAPTGADSFLHCHQRRHSAPGLRAGRNRSIREDGLRRFL